MLARFAAMLIEPDFGPIGLVEQLPNEPEKATITFQAHGLHNPDRWVFLGDVFAVSVVRELTRPFDPAKLGALPKMRTAVPYAYTLLKVISRIENGQCQCQILTRFQDPFGRDALNRDARNRLGIRAMKLTTVEANVRLRLVGQDGLPHQRSSALAGRRNRS